MPDKEEPKAEVAPPHDAEAQAREAKEQEGRERQSRLHKQAAEAEKRARAAERERDQAQTQLVEAQKMLQYLRESGGTTEELEERVKRIAKVEADLETRSKQTREVEKRLTAKMLASTYGVPADDLEGYDTVVEMENAALKYALAHQSEGSDRSDGVKEGSKPAGKPKKEEEPPPPGSSFDIGASEVPPKPIADMSKSEFENYYKRMMAKASVQARKR